MLEQQGLTINDIVDARYGILFLHCILGTENTNKGIIIDAQSQGANATILSASLCLVNVVSGPWYIQNTHSVLSLTNGKKHFLAMNVVYYDKLESI